MRRISGTFLFCCLVSASWLLAAPRAALALDASDLPSAIENAKTPADHEAIAAYYDAEAKAAREKVEEHRTMASAYKGHKESAGGKGTRPAVYKTMPGHCDDLVKLYENARKEYEAMAAAHRKAASEIK
jgi:hypothetical protein